MSIEKTLLALAAAALALTGFASSAMAETDGVVRDVTTKQIIFQNVDLHFVGWTKYETQNWTLECHATYVIEAVGTTGSTGDVTSGNVPDTSKCTLTGSLLGCKLSEHSATNLPWDVTVTPTDFYINDFDTNEKEEVIPTIITHQKFSMCLFKSSQWTFSKITFTPLKTGARVVTNTSGHLGEIAQTGDPVAGFKVHAAGTNDLVNIFGGESKEALTITGELELTEPDRCTWFISTS